MKTWPRFWLGNLICLNLSLNLNYFKKSNRCSITVTFEIVVIWELDLRQRFELYKI